MVRALLLVFALAFALPFALPVWAQGTAANLQQHPLEDPARGVIANRPAILAALDLKPGLTVADIGAGTGAFMEGIARAVGPRGRYFGVDIDRDYVATMQGRAARLRLANATIIHSRPDSITLPANSVDLMVVIDAYHHFEPVEPMLASMLAALRPGGRLVIVDFDRKPDSPRWLQKHVRADKETFLGEIRRAGFVFDRDLEVAGLTGHFVSQFVKPR
ncbi:MAG: methyltransferase domain-containing protein [Sphingomonadaceae bacterium]